MSQAKVTIIGRPNVGKSSFFNMFVGHKIAIVADEAGTTRDISEYDMIDQDTGISYIVADSGGLDFGSKEDEVAVDIIERTKMAIQESQLLIWLVEYDGFTTLDEQIYDVLRKQSKIPYVLVANKADNETKSLEAYSIAGKGEEMFFPISVSHNYGLKDIKTWVVKYLKSLGYVAPESESGEDQAIKLAVLGRPNVGKSSLINALVGKDRVMVKDLAGTTRDSVDTKFSFEGREYTLIDTAGIRRLSKIGTRNVENRSVMRSERSLKRADVIAVVMDGDDGVVQQDLHIINDVLEENKGLILVINKWDKVLKKSTVSPEQMMDRYLHYLHEKIDFLPWAAVIFTSAVDRKRVDQIFEKAAQIFEWRHKRVKTSIFNEFIEQAVYKHPPTGNKKSHNPKIYYGSQVDVNPPKFILTVNNPNHFHFSYKRYLENRIRDNFGFDGTPMIIEMRGRGKYKDVVK